MKNYLGNTIPEFSTDVKQILLNPGSYANDFRENGILIFKELFASQDEQLSILKTFGDLFNWIPNNSLTMESMYIEDHTNLIKNTPADDFTGENIVLEYHLECTNYMVPQVASVWNMIHFICDSRVGKTSFIDSRYIYNSLKDEYKSFLKDCVITHIHSGVYEEAKLRYPHRAIEQHPIHGYDVLRVDSKSPGLYQVLSSYKNSAPNNEEEKFFKEIVNYIINKVHEASQGEDFWHEWSQGDLIIPDLTLMYHAVKGGFSLNERKFIGFWAFPNLKDSIDQFNDDMHLMCN